MKKSILTLIVLLGITFGAFAQGGLFKFGPVSDEEYYGAGGRQDQGLFFSLPNAHGLEDDTNGSPLGSGALLLIGFGAAYAGLRRKNRK